MAGLVIAARAANNRIGVSRAGRINNQQYITDGHLLGDSVNQLYDRNTNEQLLINQTLTEQDNMNYPAYTNTRSVTCHSLRTLNLIILIILLAACGQPSKRDDSKLGMGNSIDTQIELIDSLGKVSFKMPRRYDTSFNWTHISDCGKPCNIIKYRFQSKSLRVTKESGFIWLGEPSDSVDRFTISHSGYFPFDELTDSLYVFSSHEHERNNLLVEPSTYKIEYDTIRKYGDRYFSIFVINLYDSIKLQYSKKVLGSTTIKGNSILFCHELLTRNRDIVCDSFINNSLYYLSTINISNGR